MRTNFFGGSGSGEGLNPCQWGNPLDRL